MFKHSPIFENAGGSASRNPGSSRLLATARSIPRLRPAWALLPFFALPAFAQPAQSAASKPAGDVVVLDKVEVSETADNQAPLNVTGALNELIKTPGSVSVIDSNAVSRGRVGTAADVLAYQPGVFAQSTGGQDALRVSIRGSGINRGQGSFREGITFLFDGLPLTGPGGSPYELFEPLGLTYTEILRGANGFKYGGLALGGAINYVTKTGYDASPFEVRGELGSFGYRKGQIASGQVIGKADYYVTVVGSERDGFQDLTEGNSLRGIANFGYRFNDTISNRIYIRYGQTKFENPGNLTVSQIEDDPTQSGKANGTVPTSSPLWNAVANNATNPLYYSRRIQQGSTWVADKLTSKISPDSTLDLGVVFHDYPIDIQGTTANLGNVTAAQKTLYPALNLGTPVYLNTIPGLSLGGSRSVWQHDDLTLSARYTNTAELFDRQSVTTAGVLSTTELVGKVTTYTDNSRSNHTQTRSYDGSANHVLFASNEIELFPKLWSSLDGQLINVVRKARYSYVNPVLVNPDGVPLSYERDVYRFAPRFGLRYDVTPDVQVFGNVSKSYEPADSWKYNAIRNSSNLYQSTNSTSGQKIVPWTDLHEQEAITVELGTRAKAGIFDGGVTVYHSWLKNELLTATDPAAPTTTTNFNATDTIHQGLEVSLNTLLWQEGGVDRKVAPGEPVTRISFRQAYTANDFHYVDDGVKTPTNNHNAKNTLPGLPPQFYQGELLFELSNGLYFGVNTQVSSSYWADYKNTLRAPSYTIFGAKIGYAPPKQKWETYLDFKNLTDENYVTATTPLFNAAGNPRTAAFQPGDGFSVFGGLTYKF